MLYANGFKITLHFVHDRLLQEDPFAAFKAVFEKFATAEQVTGAAPLGDTDEDEADQVSCMAAWRGTLHAWYMHSHGELVLAELVLGADAGAMTVSAALHPPACAACCPQGGREERAMEVDKAGTSEDASDDGTCMQLSTHVFRKLAAMQLM